MRRQLGQNITQGETDVKEYWSQIETWITNAEEKTLGEKKHIESKQCYDEECQLAQDLKNISRLRMLQISNEGNIFKF